MPALGLNSTLGATEFVAALIDHLRVSSALLRSGATYIPITGRQAVVPRLLTDGAATWTAEGAAIASSAPMADQVTLVPKKLANVLSLSREAIADAPIDQLDLVAKAMAASVATALDAAAFSATAATSVAPAGLRSYTLPSVSGTGVTVDRLLTAIGTIEGVGGIARAIFINPTDLIAVRLLKEASGSNRPLITEDLTEPGVTRLGGATFILAPALPTGTVLVADTTQIYVGLRQDIAIDVSEHAAFGSDQVMVRITARADLAPGDSRGLVVVSG